MSLTYAHLNEKCEEPEPLRKLRGNYITERSAHYSRQESEVTS